MNNQEKADKYNQEGISYANQKQFVKATQCFKKAIKFNKNPHSYYFLGLTSQLSGDMQDAEKHYKEAVEVDPYFSMAHNNLGVILLEKKDFKNAAFHLESSIAADSKNAFAYVNLGNAYRSLDREEEAVESWNKAILKNPHLPEAYNNLGLIKYKQERFNNAVEFLKKAIEVDPNYPPPYFHLGVIYAKENQLDLAIKYLEKHIKITLPSEEALGLLGNIYLRLGEYDKSLASFNKALEVQPNSAFIINDLGNLYKSMGNLNNAMECYKKALSINPNSSGSQHNVGVVYFNLGMYEEAKEAFKKALDVNPSLATSHYHLGLLFEREKKLDFAAQNLLKALKINPKMSEALGVLVYILMKSCDWEEYRKRSRELDKLTLEEIKKGIRTGETPFLSTIRKGDPQLNIKIAKDTSRHIGRSVSNVLSPFVFSDRKKKKIITIGYLSNDFYDHATTHLILGLFNKHNKNKFKINVYSYGLSDKSNYRQKIEKECDKFIDISELSHPEAAKQIYKDGVDILVDLKGYTRDSRLEIAALKPAPIVVNYLGYPGSTGALFFDYIIVDKTIVSQGMAPYYTEKLVYLPDSYQINDNNREIGKIEYKRKNFNLPEDGIIFSCFNHTYKIDSKTFSVWMKILKKVPKSTLWLLESNSFAVENIKEEVKKYGINPNRIIFSSLLPNDRHLARLKLADIALDTFTCNGHTTTSDALWTGLPVVTLLGKHFASRVSASLLSAVGLTELIAKTEEEYERFAVKLANSSDLVKSLKEKLAKNKLEKPLFNTEKFVVNLEKAYIEMWKNFLSGKPKQIIVKNKELK